MSCFSYQQTQQYEQFNPAALLNGELSQLDLFLNSHGPKSLYVEWIPECLLNKTNAINLFEGIGKVSDIDYVKRKTNGHMMFVHFSELYYGCIPKDKGGEFATSVLKGIIDAYPKPYQYPCASISNAVNQSQYKQVFILNLRINVKPVQRIEYNNAQLTDMVDRLRLEIEELKSLLAKK